MHYRISALYYTDRICLEPLTSYMHLQDVRGGQPRYTLEVMRILEAFAAAVRSLQQFYDELLQVKLLTSLAESNCILETSSTSSGCKSEW